MIPLDAFEEGEALLTKADSQTISGDLHATLVFENRSDKWQIVHEHISTPVRDTASAVSGL
ncbi:hypothetical protein SAMD00079811_58370 [Scytonema sp. HK-05]|uniref:nuclear transport factor 2 family protein n=1 Tax=Scytonema sp. HK-05 TaxID=1137095 RepID=UPI000935980E|nr:nuclear transport factor 2 family protein [Scytonema sp. HK-05]OKH58804.1 hypothetical protein NIES2130_11900 [Scytonema sp. HK-05]BAY48216.1 hypothetical protein SAMD00079811_58370 [Scytonema sp. HK-05]